MSETFIQPTTENKRIILLDILRGFAILGICLANYPEFGLWTFLSADSQEIMPTNDVDKIVRYLQYFFIDAKFYSIFSILFGIGFSIILRNATERGLNAKRLFFRRMIGLAIIGLMHLLFVWSGDILLLYAVVGMFLPFVYKLSNKILLQLSVALICFPVVLDFVQEIFGVRFSQIFINLQWYFANKFSITEDNFATWLRDADSYKKVLQFLIMGFFERMSEFVDGHRFFKVLGLFLFGFYIGKNKLYNIAIENFTLTKRLLLIFIAIGVAANFCYAWSATQGHPLGLTMHSFFYTLSATPLAVAYMLLIAIIHLKNANLLIFKAFSKPGRTALTNYIMQSIIGIIIFYGIGFGLGTKFGLYQIEIIAIIVYVCQIVVSFIWLKYFKFGPLEWLWRIFNYKKLIGILKEKK